MSVKNRFLSAALVLLLLIACFPLSTFASSVPVMTVDKVSGLRGDTVEVTVSLDRADGIASGGFTLAYDTSVLTLTDAVAGNILKNTQCNVNKTYSANSLRLNFAGINPLPGGGTLLTVTFQIKSGAAFGESAVTASHVKFMDVNSAVVSREAQNGCVTVQGAALSLSSASVAAGESTSLILSVDAPVPSCGCSLILTYDASAFSVGRIIGVHALGNTPITFSSSVNAATGTIKISWISAEPIDGFGKLCTIPVTANENVGGEAAVHFSSVKFTDEKGRELPYIPPEDAVVTVVSKTEKTPQLYFLRDTASPDSSTMTVNIVLDGASKVCGGSAEVRYDTNRCALKEIKALYPGLVLNPSAAADANGNIKLAWSTANPISGEQPLVSLIFRTDGIPCTALTFSRVQLCDARGEAVYTYSADDDRADETAITLFLGLPAQDLKIMRASYDENGRMTGSTACQTEVLSAAVTQMGAMIPVEKRGEVKLFLLDSSYRPLGQNLRLCLE